VPCERYEPHLVAYVDGELDATLYDELSAHLKVCRECREAVRNVRISSAILRKWQTARPATSLVESVRRRIETEGAVPGTDADVVEITTRMAGRRRAPVIGRRRHVLAIAAVVLLAVGLTLVFWHSTPPGLDRTPSSVLTPWWAWPSG